MTVKVKTSVFKTMTLFNHFLLKDIVCYMKTTLESSTLYFSSFSILILSYDKFLIITKNKRNGIEVKKVTTTKSMQMH